MAFDDQKKVHQEEEEEEESSKEKLGNPFENLVTISSSLASFTLLWNILELFFKSIEKSIQTLESESDPDQSPSSFKYQYQYDWFVDPRPETKQFCLDMDGKGLVSYLIQNPKERNNSLASALLFAPDPALLVLDALLACFYPKHEHDEHDEHGAGAGSGENLNLVHVRRNCCVHLLEELMTVSSPSSSLSLSIRVEVMEEARKLAMEWKERISSSSSCSRSMNYYWEALGFLLLVAVYRLGSEFNSNGELLNLVEIIIAKRYHMAFELCIVFGFEDRVSEIVEDLIRKREHAEAISYICKFGLVDKFSVFKLLREIFRDGKKEAKEICKMGNDSLESKCKAIDRQIAVVRDVIRCVENHKIECKYNSKNLRLRIRQLISKKKDLRRNAGESGSAIQWQHQGGKKHPPSLAAEEATKDVKHQILAAEEATENVKRQILAAEEAQKNVKHQMLATEEAPQNVNHQMNHQMLAAEDAPQNVNHQMLAAEGALKNVNHQMLAAEVAHKDVNHQMLTAEGAQKNAKRQCLAAEAAPKNVASDPPLDHPIQQPKCDQMSTCTSQNSPVLNSQAGSYRLASFASATNTYLSSSGGHNGFNGIYAGSGGNMNPGQFQSAETHKSNFVSGMAGGLFNKKKKKIVGLVGSAAGIHKS